MRLYLHFPIRPQGTCLMEHRHNCTLTVFIVSCKLLFIVFTLGFSDQLPQSKQFCITELSSSGDNYFHIPHNKGKLFSTKLNFCQELSHSRDSLGNTGPKYFHGCFYLNLFNDTFPLVMGV
jgi:hypothetical protein